MKKTKYKTPSKTQGTTKRRASFKSEQQTFFKAQKKYFGGALTQGKRKSIRPLSAKESIHFVMRSCWAVGKDSFLVKKNRHQVDLIISHFAKKFGVKIYQRAINSNHIHLLLKITNRVLYRAFIKAVTGKIASHVMGRQSFKLFSHSRRASAGGDGVADRKLALKKDRGFWEFRPFSRLVNWGRDFNACVKYLKQNVLEALGFVPYEARKNYYAADLADLTSTDLGG